MEPKDLKNSKELKATEKSEPKNAEKNSVSEEKAKKKSEINPEEKKKDKEIESGKDKTAKKILADKDLKKSEDTIKENKDTETESDEKSASIAPEGSITNQKTDVNQEETEKAGLKDAEVIPEENGDDTSVAKKSETIKNKKDTDLVKVVQEKPLDVTSETPEEQIIEIKDEDLKKESSVIKDEQSPDSEKSLEEKKESEVDSQKDSPEKEDKTVSEKVEEKKQEDTETTDELKKTETTPDTQEPLQDDDQKITVVGTTDEKKVVQSDIKEKSKEEAQVKPGDNKAEVSDEETIASEKAKRKKTTVKKKVKVEKAPEVEETDYSGYSQIELVNALRDVLDNNSDHDIKREVDTIKSIFYKNLNENIEKAKKEFIEEGGEPEDFKAPEDPYERDIKDLLKRYRQIRIEFNKKLEIEKEENLKLKYQVIEEIKGLINNEESINKTFHEFRELQRRWREIGLVPQSKMKNLWDTYHFHVENFYDYIKINRELRDLDLKKNLEAKIKLCERAEELLVEPSVLKAFNTLQKYHEQWREIGPVPRDNKDDIWERFKAATSKINRKHQEYFESRKTEQKQNLEAKIALCEKVEEILEEELETHKEWDEKSKELIKLQKVWRTIGFAPRKDNNRIYERFRSACDNFFDAKREFYTKNKELQQNNLQLKIDLCVQAEALKDSSDWRKTTQDFINIQKKWKEIGPVPRKFSDTVWKRFRSACDYFFNKKSEHFSSIDDEQIENLKLKEELIREIINFKSSGDVDQNLKSLKDFQRRWTEIGHVPFKKKDEIQNKFRESINKLFDELNIDEDKRNLLKFRSKMNSLSESSRGQNKMRMEREKYINKLKQLENDLVLLDNNIGFFAKSKNAETLIKDVKKKIEITKQKIEFLKEKIRVIDDIDKSEE